MMKTIRLFFLAVVTCLVASSGVLSTGCNEEAIQPAFLRIDSIVLDSTSKDSVGSLSNKIEYAWVYLNDNLQGVYQLPMLVPVIADGSYNIKVFGGVRESGFSTQANRYIFYDLYETTDTLTPGDTTQLNPHVKYKHMLIPFIDNFDNITNIKLDRQQGTGTATYNQNGGAYEGSGFFQVLLGEGETEMVCTTHVVITPKGLPGYFIEMDYKNNCNFSVGVQTSQGNLAILTLFPKDDWNKIYINATPYVDDLIGTDLQVYFYIPQDTTIASQEVDIDNLKLVF